MAHVGSGEVRKTHMDISEAVEHTRELIRGHGYLIPSEVDCLEIRDKIISYAEQGILALKYKRQETAKTLENLMKAEIEGVNKLEAKISLARVMRAYKSDEDALSRLGFVKINRAHRNVASDLLENLDTKWMKKRVSLNYNKEETLILPEEYGSDTSKSSYQNVLFEPKGGFSSKPHVSRKMSTAS